MSDETNPNLQNLRGFRIQKKPTFSHNPKTNLDKNCKAVMSNRRRILPLVSSDSEEEISNTDGDIEVPLNDEEIFENNPENNNSDDENNKKITENGISNSITNVNGSAQSKTNDNDVKKRTMILSNLSVRKSDNEKVEKEKLMHFLMQNFKADVINIRKLFTEYSFDIHKTIKKLCEIEGKSFNIEIYENWKKDLHAQNTKTENKTFPNMPVLKRKAPTSIVPQKKKRIRRADYEEDTDDSTNSNNDFSDRRIYNCSSDDDSDIESEDEFDGLSNERKGILEFLQNATPSELQLMPFCSKKKVECIVECRPFTSWVDLVTKLKNSKNLNTELLNSARKVLITRENIRNLMKKCINLVQQMERAIAADAAIKTQPKTLSSSLKLTGYQMVGLNWLAVLHAHGVNGILADEMGLGKTIQVIAFLAHLKEIGAARTTHLIVVPSSTLDNWRTEFERWCPTLRVFMYFGSTEERRAYRMDWSKGELKKYDVILTTYTMVGNSPEERKMFRITLMHYVIFDEAHMLKNMNTQRYENLIRINATNRILLTGTPLQNNLLELMSLLIFVMPKIFAEKTEDLKNLFQKNSKLRKEGGEDMPKFEAEQIEQAKRIMKPFVLRRLKKDVLKDLPQKFDSVITVPLAPTQREQYDNLVESFKNVPDDFRYNGMSMMSDLRKLSNHPLLLRYHYQYEDLPELAKLLAKDPSYKDTKEEYIIDDLACMSDFEIHTMTKQFKSIADFSLPDNLLLTSGKFLYLDKKLKELKSNNHRVLIFSQYVILLDVMEEYLKIRKHTYLRMDGSTPVAFRQELIDEYTQNEDIFIFLLSTRAGGLGINLTAADTVIIHDIDFNPYNDKQAEDRCHRMGQTKAVTVFRLISECTIEENMWQMNQEKLKLEREITADGGDENTDVKSVVCLLSSALGVNTNKIANLVSPKKR